MHRRDAVIGCLTRAVECYLLAFQSNHTRTGLVDARQQPDDSRLASAVIAQQAQNLARAQLKRDVMQHVDGAERLVNIR